MPNPYSLDLRARILKDYDSGVPVEDLVAHYEVSRSWTYSLIKKRNETGSIAPRVYRPGRKKKLVRGAIVMPKVFWTKSATVLDTQRSVDNLL